MYSTNTKLVPLLSEGLASLKLPEPSARLPEREAERNESAPGQRNESELGLHKVRLESKSYAEAVKANFDTTDFEALRHFKTISDERVDELKRKLRETLNIPEKTPILIQHQGESAIAGDKLSGRIGSKDNYLSFQFDLKNGILTIGDTPVAREEVPTFLKESFKVAPIRTALLAKLSEEKHTGVVEGTLDDGTRFFLTRKKDDFSLHFISDGKVQLAADISVSKSRDGGSLFVATKRSEGSFLRLQITQPLNELDPKKSYFMKSKDEDAEVTKHSFPALKKLTLEE